ncbi:hypothetical protein A3751_17600, partial [Oleiphilus sp. HI0080]
MNLLTELVPDGSEAGVWTFGQWVNNLVRFQVVDDAWRAMAKEKAKEINSVALRTNIGAALEKASENLEAGQQYPNTHFILLTDGMVDIDKEPAKNTAERERILGPVLARIAQTGAHVHTVSLSKNADKPLMDKLAIGSGGQSALAESSDDLSRVFLQAFDQAVPQEQVPIEGNAFVIDSSIEEFTALVFKKEGAKPVRLVSPDLETIEPSSGREDVHWYSDAGYELITVSQPDEGEWVIDAEVDPDSRVTIVSNLQMDVTSLPSNIFAGDVLDVKAGFLNEGELIEDEDFLSILEVDLVVTNEEGKSGKRAMATAGDGVFSETISKLKTEGAYRIAVDVDGKTFKRRFEQVVNLRPPFDFELSAKGGEQPQHQLVVTALTDDIDIDGTSVFAKVKAPDGTSLIKAVEQVKGTKQWRLAVTPEAGDGTYKVAVKVKGRKTAGEDVNLSPKVFEVEFPIPLGEANMIVAVEEEAAEPVEGLDEPAEPEPALEESIAPNLAESNVEPELVPEEELEPEESGVDYVLWGSIAGGVASLLALLGTVFYFLRKKKAAQEPDDEVINDSIMDQLNDTSIEDVDFDAEPEPEPEPEP